MDYITKNKVQISYMDFRGLCVRWADNGRMEAFHSILKREEVYLKAYQTLTEVQAAIGWYINFYNRNRISNVA